MPLDAGRLLMFTSLRLSYKQISRISVLKVPSPWLRPHWPTHGFSMYCTVSCHLSWQEVRRRSHRMLSLPLNSYPSWMAIWRRSQNSLSSWLLDYIRPSLPIVLWLFVGKEEAWLAQVYIPHYSFFWIVGLLNLFLHFKCVITDYVFVYPACMPLLLFVFSINIISSS